MTSADLNRVIDDVARGMTAGRAAPDVRTRILDQLDDHRPWRWSLALVPAAIALAVVAVMLVRPGDRPAGVAPDSTTVVQAADRRPGAEHPNNLETPRDGMTPNPAENADARRSGTMA